MVKIMARKDIKTQKNTITDKPCPYQMHGCLKYLNWVGLHKNMLSSTCGNKLCLKRYHKIKSHEYRKKTGKITVNFRRFLKRYNQPKEDFNTKI